MTKTFVGVDWGEDHHGVVVMAADGRVLAQARIAEGVAGIRQLHALIADHAEALEEVVIGIETDRGLLVGALLAAGYDVVAVNPKAPTATATATRSRAPSLTAVTRRSSPISFAPTRTTIGAWLATVISPRRSRCWHAVTTA